MLVNREGILILVGPVQLGRRPIAILSGILRHGVSLGQREVANRIGIGIVAGVIDWELLAGFTLACLSNY